ncbi:MAG: hypothetical protein Q8918_07970 [Bacteroidota bacterium]|nr:hypothetical protein [Bacteroidota bacterium]MDP4211277.1 hypothetical protein [Bacteroidota bacterium]MDP4250034.1 hypothetical protein [Bacteroidota bacterium]
MFYTAAWCIDGEDDFKKALPLELLGESMQRFPSGCGFTIVMLEGMNLLSRSYIRSLEESGFLILDYTAAFQKIIQEYPSLSIFYSRYERNCFLRWIAFMQICQTPARSGKQFWHLDSDVILHTSLDRLVQDSRGKTFMLQGCPVFLTVSDFSWFIQYEQHLKKLDQDIPGYSERAFLQKEICLQNDSGLFNQSLYRNPIGSDQDLLEYLVSSRQIPQDPRDTILDIDLYYIQNALSLKHWHRLQAPAGAVFEATENGQISIGRKLIPFIHYQNTFTRFAGVFLLLRGLKVPDIIIRLILRYRIADEHFYTTFLFRLIARFNKSRRGGAIRKQVMGKMMSGGHLIIDLLNLLLQD